MLPIPTHNRQGAAGPTYNWNGFYAGGRVGYALGGSNWTASSPGTPNMSGSLDLFQPLNAFKGTGSYVFGLQAGYNYLLPSHWLIGSKPMPRLPTRSPAAKRSLRRPTGSRVTATPC